MSTKWFLVCCAIVLASQSFAQSAGFGVYQPPNVTCLSREQHEAIVAKLAISRAALIAEGVLPKHDPAQRMTTLFAWPIEQYNGLDDYGVHGISNFVDQNPEAPNQILDYNCGARSYDLASGYNHGGIDMYLWPFAWYKMEHDQVKVVAAAPGVILDKSDGNFDMNCGFNSSDWNAVYVQHEDGSVAWYGHLKNGSVTTSEVGSTVERGEYLGIVGSSGSSTGPHLHFEIHNAAGGIVDPYEGPCNSLNAESWWIEQRPYFDSGINALRTQSAPTDSPPCPGTEVPFEQNTWCGNDLVYFVNYLRDQQPGQAVQYTILRPNGTIWQEWDQLFTQHYSSSWWYWNYFLPATANTGQWIFRAEYEGQTYERVFDVIGLTSITVDGETEVCFGETVTLHAPVGEYGFEYQWSRDDVDIPGATANELLVTESGTYRVQISATGACSTTSQGKTITVNPELVVDLGPDTIATDLPFTLDAGPGWDSYAWSVGSAGTHILIVSGGYYSVTVTDSNGCTGVDSVYVEELFTDVNDVQSTTATMYPNPVRDRLYVELHKQGDNTELDVLDCTGRVIYHQLVSTVKTEIDLSHMQPGLYMLRIKQKHAEHVWKVIRL
jgi:murein DD-endopeptidase MepM/ murein hydrolase activator NlpD